MIGTRLDNLKHGNPGDRRDPRDSRLVGGTGLCYEGRSFRRASLGEKYKNAKKADRR